MKTVDHTKQVKNPKQTLRCNNPHPRIIIHLTASSGRAIGKRENKIPNAFPRLSSGQNIPIKQKKNYITENVKSI